MINAKELLSDLQRLLPKIEGDILRYSEKHKELAEHLQSQYHQTREAGRTAEHFVAWREAQITQAAVAWVLTCVFLRFLEDNQLLDEPMLAGPVEREDGSKPLQLAKECITAYFNENPAHAEREYLLNLFEHLERFPVITELLDHRHNPLWQIPVSADGAKALIDFYQRIDPHSGELVHDFTDPDWDTRFVGDLYQDLSESVRKRYALLQTPEFVESFILDYTLEKAIDTFGLPEVRLIDPTCGSGHFLLTTFERVFAAWTKREPATNARALAQRALDVVHGVDINPYAIAICRFRLLIAAMNAAQSTKIKNAPDFHFNLACGDSLLHGPRFEWQGQGLQSDMIDEDPIKHVLEVEDKEKLSKILGQQYHVVVGNPPYITVKDQALSQAYRHKYPTCHRQYSLGVPFTERFFDLTFSEHGNRPAGYMGMITANSFMKREFGKKLIEEYLVRKDVTHLIDTSGAHIPGHGTPTVILFARNQSPVKPDLRSVLGVRGEPKTPSSGDVGEVWRSIKKLISTPGSESEYVTCLDQPRYVYSKHPWSIAGGVAAELSEVIGSENDVYLEHYITEIGRTTHTGDDDAFYLPKSVIESNQLSDLSVPLVVGEQVRNWLLSGASWTLFPYGKETGEPVRFLSGGLEKHFWKHRAGLKRRKDFGKYIEERGLKWFEHSMFFPKRFLKPLSIAFPFVATHNHFVLDRGGKVFKQTAPVIKLPDGSSEADHLVLLGLLNSSLACFWGRQTFFPKGGFADGKWEERLEWDGTKLKRFPIPKPLTDSAKNGERLLPGYGAIESLARQLDKLAQELSALLPEQVLSDAQYSSVIETLDASHQRAKEVRAAMVALQEELDWLCYHAYGITEQSLAYDGELPPINAGERAFEITMARALAGGDGSDAWFTRHKLNQTTEMPSHWPADYRELVQQRMAVAEDDRSVRLLEQPEHKRRWLPLDWQDQEQAAIRAWLLRFLEQASFETSQPELTTCAKLADALPQHELANRLAQRYTGTELYDSQSLVTTLIADEEVPQMAPARLKPAAIKKFQAWQETWDKQRLEDTIDAEFDVAEPLSEADAEDEEARAAYERAKQQAEAKKSREVGAIPVPPKYDKGDFRKGSYWTLRGKLDVPKERFFSLPGCEKPGDATLVIGWAGMDHMQRAQAIAAWYIERKESNGWDADQLMPMLVALDELIPWLKQWHNELNPEYGQRMGDFYEGFLLGELRTLGIAQSQLDHWQPQVASRGRRTTARSN